LGDGAVDEAVMEALATDMVAALGESPETQSRGLDWDLLAGLISTLDERFHVGEAILRLFLKDLADYLTKEELRQRVVARVAGAIEDAGRPVALLAHSMGTVVGYDVLMRHPDLPVRAFVTFGSVLGFPTTRRFVADANGQTPFPPTLPRWINVYNRTDFATVVRELAPLYTASDGRRVEDLEAKGANPSVLDPMAGHRPTLYLSSATMAKALHSILEGTSET
jgi:pimeloyl-ACP methyl ester carboxylesterase